VRSRAGFETTPSLMSTAVSPPREVGGLSKTWPFPGWMQRGECERSAAMSSQVFMSICLFSLIFGSVFETISLCTLFATS